MELWADDEHVQTAISQEPFRFRTSAISWLPCGIVITITFFARRYELDDVVFDWALLGLLWATIQLGRGRYY